MKRSYWFMLITAVVATFVGATLATRYSPAPSQQAVGGFASPTPTTVPTMPSSPSPPISPQVSESPEAIAASPTPTPTPSPDKLTANSKVTVIGIGPIKVGMTVAEASQAAGVPLVSEGESPTPGCEYVVPQDGLADVAFMVIDGRIARVDVWSGGRVTTPSGLGVGSTEDEIKQLFPNQIELEPHEYIDGHYVIFVPRDRADSNYRIVFETDRTGRVTQFRSGKLPEVMWVEGCA